MMNGRRSPEALHPGATQDDPIRRMKGEPELREWARVWKVGKGRTERGIDENEFNRGERIGCG